MIKFMGNGKRIENIVRCLTSGFVVSIYHPRTQLCCVLSYHETELISVVRFMTSCGYSDVFVLAVAE